MAAQGLDVRSRAAAVGVALLGGACLAAGAPPLNSRAAPFVGLLFLCMCIRKPVSPGLAALLGALFGATTHALGLATIAGVFERFGGVPTWLALMAAPLLWLLQGLPYSLACWLTALSARKRALSWAFWPCALTASTALSPQIFPFQPGALAGGWLWLAQVAELGGTALVTLCMALTAAAALELFRAQRPTQGPLVALCFTLVIPNVYGAVRMRQVRAQRLEASWLRLGAVQPNVSMASLATPAGQHEALRVLRALGRDVARERVDLTVWPESGYPFRLSRTRTVQPLSPTHAIRDAEDGPVLFGALTYAFHGQGEREYNSAWLATTTGTLAERVDKKHLLPFAETIPFWHELAFMRARYRSPGLVSGTSGLIHVRDQPLGVLICYEDLIASLAREHALSGARALVNLTNDGWFGESSVPALHDALARMRSIETRRDFVRVTNTGVSSFTAATGERLDHTKPFTRATFVAEVRLLSGRTPYVRFGEWVAVLCILACVAMVRGARKLR